MAKAISPADVAGVKAELFPEAVFEAFNELIAAGFYGNEVTVKQEDVVKRMVEKGLKVKDIYANHWLDVEEVYRAAGWVVEYDKPGYNESYAAYFVFRKKSR